MVFGVLALQGAFREHENMLKTCGVETRQVRLPSHLEGLSGLIIPGGESTTIGKLLIDFGLMEPIRVFAEKGLPIFGTCAGLILLAKDIIESDQPRLGLMNITARRNAYGRQVDSFEADVMISELGEPPFRTVFIRAPYIEAVEPEVQVLAEHEGRIILAREKNFLAAAFHPELTDDRRMHQYFIDMAKM